MAHEDEKLEAFLRRFQPRQPSPLPRGRATPRSPLWMAAGLAACVLGAAAMTWRAIVPRSAPGVSEAPTGVAQASAEPSIRATNWDAAALDRTLLEVSARVLPDVEQPDGVLRALAVLSSGEPQR